MNEAIENLARKFEAELTEGPAPVIEDYLTITAAESHPKLVKRLVEAELLLSPDVSLRDYLDRFPSHQSSVNAAFHSFEKTLDVARTIHGESETGCSILSKGNLSRLLAISEPVEAAEGEYLIRHGEVSSDLFVIEAGAVSVQLPRESGSLILAELAAGSIVGEMALLSAEPRTADVIVTSKLVAGRIRADAFHELAREYPELASVLTELVAQRLGTDERDALADKVLNGYRIDRKLGRGGSGIVYAATDTQTSDRVALKMMSHRLVYASDASRWFRREADVLMSIDHPNIIAMKGCFNAFHTCFLVMERCDGQTLKQFILDNGPANEQRTRDILKPLLAALQYAHGRGVVHRDLKPDNVMLLNDGTVKLMDFGLAATADDIQSGVCGTVRYMAPEQRLGEPVAGAADYFSLGCVAWELITGSPLFQGSLTEELCRDFQQWAAPLDVLNQTGVSKSLSQFVCACLNTDDNSRTGQVEAVDWH